MFACVADGRSGRLDWVCAGHNPPIVVRADGSYELLSEGGPVMGIFSDLSFPQMQSTLRPGDLLVIYSDGITEACSGDEQEFDIPVLAGVVAKNRERPASEIVEAILTAVGEWTADAPPADDMTLIVVRKL